MTFPNALLMSGQTQGQDFHWAFSFYSVTAVAALNFL